MDASTPVALLFIAAMSAFFLGLLWFLRESIPITDFLGTQSEFPHLHVTTVTNDEVQEYHAGLFAFDAIRRIDEWRAAAQEAIANGTAVPDAPAPEQDCPASFGNTDIFGGAYADPTPPSL